MYHEHYLKNQLCCKNHATILVALKLMNINTKEKRKEIYKGFSAKIICKPTKLAFECNNFDRITSSFKQSFNY